MKMVVKAAGFVIFRQKVQIEFLLMQASYGDHHWTPPKGHVDKGESDFKTALRETEEEAGFKETDLKIITDFKKVLEYNVRGKPKMVTYWLAELVGETPVTLSSEHQAYKWLPLAEACEVCGYKEMEELLKESHSFITNN